MSSETPGGRPGVPQVTIHVLRGKATSTSREMKGRSLLVGSGPQCDIQMRSPDVAGKHALLTRHLDGLVVQQLDSDYPVIVNGQAIPEGPIHHGDTIKVGPFELSVTMKSTASSARSGPEPTSGGLSRRLEGAMQGLAKLTSATHAAASTERPVVVPERLAEIQRSQADTEKELERKRRHIYDEAARLETERSAFKQEKARFETQRHELDRQIKGMAVREVELARLSQELDERAHQLAQLEQSLDARRVTIDEETIRFDRKLELFDAAKHKLLSVRRRLFQQYRDRLGTVDKFSRDHEERVAALRSERTDHEAEVTHWRRVADELGRKQADLKRLDAEVQRRVEIAERREAELRDRQTRFENEIGQVQIKDKSLESLRGDLERRKARITDEEQVLRDARQAVEEQFERAKQRSAEVQRRHEETEARRLTLDRQEQFLREQAAALEKRRQEMTELNQQLAALQAHVEMRDGEIIARLQQFETRENDLRIREIALTEEREALMRREQQLREWEGQAKQSEREIARKHADADARLGAAAEEYERQQAAAAERLEQMELERLRMEQSRENVEHERDRWSARMSEVREQASEVALRESIVRRRQEQWTAADRLGLHDPPPSSASVPATINESIESPPAAPSPQAPDAAERNRHRAQEMEAARDRMRERFFEWQGAEAEQIDCENHWIDELKRRRTGIEKLQAKTDQQKVLLARQSAAQEQRSRKLRDLTSRLFGRSPRTEPALERLQSVHDKQEHRLRESQGQQADTSQSLAETLHQLDHEVEQASLTRTRLEDENRLFSEKVESLAGEVAAAVRVLLRPGAQTPEGIEDQLAGVGHSIAEFESILAQSTRRMEDRRQVMAAIRASLPEVSATTEVEAPTPLAPPKPATIPPYNSERWALVLEHSDAEVARRLEAAHLVDGTKLAWIRQSADARAARLAEEIVRLDAATRYQVEAVALGDRPLHLGTASVVELLHEGAVATTFRCKAPGENGYLAVRLLKAQWSRDPSQRRQYEIAIESFRNFVHPSVVPLRGSLWAEERFGIVSLYVDALPLDQLLPLGVPAGVLISVCAQAMGAIAAAERAGYTHRSLRPSRLLIDRAGRLQIIGFAEPDWLTKIHRCEKGKAHTRYVAPELLTPGMPSDARSDVFSIGRIAISAIEANTGCTSLTEPSLLDLYPTEFLSLVARMTSATASERPTPSEALTLLEPMADLDAAAAWGDLAILFQQLDETRPYRSAA